MFEPRKIRRNQYKTPPLITREDVRNIVRLCGAFLGRVVFLTGLTIIAVFGHDYITQCEYFKSNQVNIDGIQHLSRQTVMSQARVNIGTNILSVNLKLAKERLTANPWIKYADIERQWPSAVDIRIREHQPVAVLDMNKKYIMNVNGEIFKEWEPSDPEDLPIVSGLKLSDLPVSGNKNSLPFRSLMEVFELSRKSHSILPLQAIKRIHLDREIGLTLYAFDRIKAVKLGFHDYPQKYKGLKTLIVHLEKNGSFSNVDSIDLNNLNRIVVNPVRTETLARDHKEV